MVTTMDKSYATTGKYSRQYVPYLAIRNANVEFGIRANSLVMSVSSLYARCGPITKFTISTSYRSLPGRPTGSVAMGNLADDR